ncbi:predicted protein [Naegleria gruberi]|uniref:Predicted protein n=1 Tax=Naegleria gruberi TaxID=5762 RepID=D2VER8_NAEGR|nr:uncharacterized protein NAEGRDRAFT_67369 [Naegleria gruberi]EFC44649.1 predicted protein [Naegleria gruberi]|eukprot:XP_002677393.1 predicted protein [Naegleria gruberi strain NEG-M]
MAVFDLHSRKFLGYLEYNIKILCLCLEMNYDGNQNEALLFSKNHRLVKYDLKSLIDLSKLGSDSTKSSDSNNSLAPIWTSERERNAFGMCIDYSSNIENRKLYVCEDEEIIVYSAHNGLLITTIYISDAWGIRMNRNGDLIYSLFYKGILEIIKRPNLENLDFKKRDFVCGTDEGGSYYASGIAIDPNNGNIIAALHSLIVLFSPDGREIRRINTQSAQGCILDETSGTLYIASNGTKTIYVYN